jgi:uncharacterized protein
MLTSLLVFLLGLLAGGVGGLLGLGGGIFIVPALTLLFGVPMKTAIAASAVSVIATSLGASTVYVRRHVANIKLGMALQVATASGALLGGLIAVAIDVKWLQVIFSAVCIYVGYSMREVPLVETCDEVDGPYCSSYHDPAANGEVRYEPRKLSLGMIVSVAAGCLSGMLGIGGGAVQVPVMTKAMGLPLKAAMATSSFMIGVTAATGASVYFRHGLVDPAITVPVVLGVFAGARVASHYASRVQQKAMLLAFQIILVVVAANMLWKAFS